ncbi:MAG: 2-amino-4-hydroxy-6-hydroxymethyldihydropteridine diphosphokinase [Actinomycetales bacterium]|nr:2-amino-4-hydroxy-6-hydroxymethyldihydropteridine diphosphokinase [Actinomycetales bacterium]
MLAVLSLGSNLGDSWSWLKFAYLEIAKRVGKIVGESSVYQTSPISDIPQEDYLNAVLLVQTELTPKALLYTLNDIESAAGRERNVVWGPRPLDLDIVDIKGLQVAEADLIIPHPRAHERAFVLVPLGEISPDWLLGDQKQLSELLKKVADQKIQHRAELSFAEVTR